MGSPWLVVHMHSISQTRQVASVHCLRSPTRGPNLCEIKPCFSLTHSLFWWYPHSSCLRSNHSSHYPPSNDLGFNFSSLDYKSSCWQQSTYIWPQTKNHLVVMDELASLLLVVFNSSPDALHVWVQCGRWKCSSSCRNADVLWLAPIDWH